MISKLPEVISIPGRLNPRKENIKNPLKQTWENFAFPWQIEGPQVVYGLWERKIYYHTFLNTEICDSRNLLWFCHLMTWFVSFSKTCITRHLLDTTQKPSKLNGDFFSQPDSYLMSFELFLWQLRMSIRYLSTDSIEKMGPVSLFSTSRSIIIKNS